MLKLKNKFVYYYLLSIFVFSYILKVLEFPLPSIVYNHISNFAILGGLFLIVNYDLLIKKQYTKKSLMRAMLPFALFNIILELFVRVDTIKVGFVEFVNFNTPDPIDAGFGILALVLIYFVVIKNSVHVKSGAVKSKKVIKGAS